MCVHVWRPRLLSVRNRNRHAHSAHTGKGLRKKPKKIMHRVPSRGVDPRVKFLGDANPTHSSLFEHTPTPVPCRPYASSSFAKLRAIKYFLPTKLTLLRFRFSPNSDGICTESNLHVFCSKRYTGSVSISIETSAKRKIRIHSAHPGPRNKDAHDVYTDLFYTTVSCPYEGRAMDPSTK